MLTHDHLNGGRASICMTHEMLYGHIEVSASLLLDLPQTGPLLILALGWRNYEAGAWKMHTDLADGGSAASDDDLMNARGDQFADDRVASGIIRRDRDDLARLPADGVSRIGGCAGD
jgi:hypothetical protein